MIYYIIEVSKWIEGQIWYDRMMDPVDDCIDAFGQLQETLIKRNEGFSSDARYECFRYKDGVKLERQWVINVD